MGRLLSIALCAIVAMFVAAGMLAPSDPPAPAAKATAAPGKVAHNSELLVLNRSSNGQFYLTAQANGEDVRFLVDTGADVVALTVEQAQALGLDVDPALFEPITETASGTGYGTAVTIDRLEVAGHEFRDAAAVVIDGLGTNLLGQSVLRQLGKVELRGDRMTIGKPG